MTFTFLSCTQRLTKITFSDGCTRPAKLWHAASTQIPASSRCFSSTPDRDNHEATKKPLQTLQPLINFTLIGKPGSGKGTYGKLLSKALQCPVVVIGDVLRNHVKMNTKIGIEIADCQREGRLASDDLVAKALKSHLRSMFNDDVVTRNDERKDGNTTTAYTINPFGFILDGFPRTLNQAEILMHKPDPSNTDATTATTAPSSPWPSKFKISFAVNIHVPDEICLSKMLGRRTCTKCNTTFNVSNIDTPDGFIMPPQLPSPFPCPNCDMEDGSDWTKRLDDTEEIMARRIEEFHEKSAPVGRYFEERGRLVDFVPFKGVQDVPVLEELVRWKASEYHGGF